MSEENADIPMLYEDVKAEIARLRHHNEYLQGELDVDRREKQRLKALIKQVESTTASPRCPWCREFYRHHADCPAFTPDGQVK